MRDRHRLAAWFHRILAVWCLASLVVALQAALAREEDPVAAIDAELRGLAVHLPPRGIIGFVEAGADAGSVDALRLRHLAQYALAPRVVIFEAGPEFLIVPHGAESAGDPRLAGYFRVASSRSGHRVFRRLPP